MIGRLLSLFTGNPVTMVYVALAIAGISASIGGYGGWTLNGWRLGTELASAQKDRDLAIAQGKVLASSTEACVNGVKRVEQLADAAIANSKQLLGEAQRAVAGGQAMAAKIEQRLAEQPGGGHKSCDDAYDELEKLGGP